MSKLELTQLHGRKQKPVYESMITLGENQLWEADLIDYSNAKYTNFNNKYKYILVIIDNFTKKTWAFPLLNKKPDEVLPLFEKVIAQQGTNPITIMTDDGGEFKEDFGRFMAKEKIQHVINEHAPHAERVIRTLKNKLSRYFTANKTRRWKTVLPDILENYNSSFNKAIGSAPKDFNDQSELAPVVRGQLLRRALVKKESIQKLRLPPLNVGDQVRIASRSNPFEKGYAQQWSQELYTITSKDGAFYKVENRRHTFRRHQLKLAGEIIEYERPKAQRAEPTIYEKAVPAIEERSVNRGRNKLTSRRVLEGFQ
jgi:hypothetical protein